MAEALLGQCRKRTLSYKAVAIATTGEVVEALRVDIFAKLSDVLFSLLETVSEQPSWTSAYLKLLKFQLIYGTQAMTDSVPYLNTDVHHQCEVVLVLNQDLSKH